MNEILNKFLLVENKLVSEINSRVPGFRCSDYELFTKSKGRRQKF